MPIDPERLPSWSEFLFVAKQQGIRIYENEIGITGPVGSEPPFRFLQRPGELEVIVPPLRLGEIMRESLLSGLCRRLRIDPTPLGISLDELPPQNWL